MLTRLVHDCCYSGSLAINALLIVLIITRTPSCYSIVLLYLSVVDISTATSSLLIYKKIMSTPEYTINVICGVCRRWDSPSLCFYLNSVQFAGISHYAVMIAFCSCYRYYVIAYSRIEPSIRSVLVALICVHLPTIAIHVYFGLSRLLEGSELERAMNDSYPEYDMSKMKESEMLLVNRRSLATRLAEHWIQGIIVPVCIVVLVASVRINAVLASLDHMSANSKRRHAQILRGLLCQATLPVLYATAVVLHRAEKRRITNSADFGHLTVTIASISAVISPLFTLTFTLPYRDALIDSICIGNRRARSSISSQHQLLPTSAL